MKRFLSILLLLSLLVCAFASCDTLTAAAAIAKAEKALEEKPYTVTMSMDFDCEDKNLNTVFDALSLEFPVTVDGEKLLDKVYFSVGKNDKIAFVGENELAQTALFQILMGELEPDEGSIKWGVSTIRSYLPKDNSEYFEGNKMELVDWLRQYSAKKDDVYLRGFLGRMLFGNDDVFKQVNVLSGGEKVRCMLSKMMLSGANVVLLDQPTNHLDMESIQAVNKGLEAFQGVVLLASHDHEMLTSTCNRVIAFQPDGTIIDKYGTYDDYLAWMAERKGNN